MEIDTEINFIIQRACVMDSVGYFISFLGGVQQ